jgi:hypothetical protein
MAKAPHVEKNFTASETVRDIVIGMSFQTFADDGIPGFVF